MKDHKRPDGKNDASHTDEKIVIFQSSITENIKYDENQHLTRHL